MLPVYNSSSLLFIQQLSGHKQDYDNIYKYIFAFHCYDRSYTFVFYCETFYDFYL